MCLQGKNVFKQNQNNFIHEAGSQTGCDLDRDTSRHKAVVCSIKSNTINNTFTQKLFMFYS